MQTFPAGLWGQQPNCQALHRQLACVICTHNCVMWRVAPADTCRLQTQIYPELKEDFLQGLQSRYSQAAAANQLVVCIR